MPLDQHAQAAGGPRQHVLQALAGGDPGEIRAPVPELDLPGPTRSGLVRRQALPFAVVDVVESVHRQRLEAERLGDDLAGAQAAAHWARVDRGDLGARADARACGPRLRQSLRGQWQVGAPAETLGGLDPRAKLVALGALIAAAIMVETLSGLAALFLLAIALAAGSGITLARLGKQVWLGVLLFTRVIALPALVIVPGEPLLQLPVVAWTVTLQGLRSAAFLVGRAETAATLALLLILITPWPLVLKALRAVGVPVTLVAVLGMTHRYIFVVLRTAMQMFEARRSRIVGPIGAAGRRRLVASGVGVLLGKTLQLSTEVHLAMIARGYRGEVRLLDDFRTRPRNWAVLLLALAVPALILWLQR